MFGRGQTKERTVISKGSTTVGIIANPKDSLVLGIGKGNGSLTLPRVGAVNSTEGARHAIAEFIASKTGIRSFREDELVDITPSEEDQERGFVLVLDPEFPFQQAWSRRWL